MNFYKAIIALMKSWIAFLNLIVDLLDRFVNTKGKNVQT